MILPLRWYVSSQAQISVQSWMQQDSSVLNPFEKRERERERESCKIHVEREGWWAGGYKSKWSEAANGGELPRGVAKS